MVRFIVLLLTILGWNNLLSSNEAKSEEKNSDKTPRKTYSINKNNWKFKREDVKNAYKAKFDDSDWLSVTIPHDFNGGSDGLHNDVFDSRFDLSTDTRKMYKGPAWYRTILNFDKKDANKRVFIEFEAVSLVSEVYINDNLVGTHKGGYTAFSYDITDFIKFGKENTLAVKADNTNNPAVAPFMFDEKRSFPFSFDYAIYGGIYRDVWIHITDPIKIEKVFNTPVTGGQAPSVLGIDTYVKNYGKETQKVKLTSEIYAPDGKLVSTVIGFKTIEPGQTAKYEQSESALGDVKLWVPNNPNVYKVISKISYNDKVVDQYESVCGFRYYTLANNQGFIINGKNTLIQGVNRHQDMEGRGYALPNEQHWADAKIIKNIGFNAVRHAHYPCDREFAKACDELGLMLWLEIPLSGTVSEDPAFLDNVKTQMQEMVEQYYNNPSVIVWGVGNESDRSGANEAGSNKVYKELVNVAKNIDPNRPTTGCNFKYKSNEDIVDVYAPQDWGGWYGGAINQYSPNRMIGEYGADAQITNHSEDIAPVSIEWVPATKTETWSQEYVCQLHEYKLSMGRERKDKFPGHFVWIAFDFASPRIDRGMNPIPYMNQKGIMLHDHKTPKDVYYMYQSNYRSAEDYPMVYIVSETWKDRWETPGRKDVWVYSNCDSVILYNDLEKTKSFGARVKNAGPRGDTRFQWDNVAMSNNVLYAEAWYKNKVVATDTLSDLTGNFGMVANFSLSTSVIEAGKNVEFKDLSTREGDSWNWIFEGGTPSESTNKNPVITYNKAGIYGVGLTIKKGENEVNVSKKNCIRVYQPNNDLLIDFNLTPGKLDPDYVAYNMKNMGGFSSQTYDAFNTKVKFTVENASGADQNRSIDRNRYNSPVYKNLLDDLIGLKGIDKKKDAVLKLTFEGLPEGKYNYTSYHHDASSLNLNIEIKVVKANGDEISYAFQNTNGENVEYNKVAKANATFTITKESKGPVTIWYKCIGTTGEDNWVVINGLELTKVK